jgi:SagB-type dehydrogenase family enzyme
MMGGMKYFQKNLSSGFPGVPGELGELLVQRRSVRAYTAAAISAESVKRVLLAGQGITSPEGRRSTPSAHALYPLKLYLLARRVGRLEPGFYTFDPMGPAVLRSAAVIPRGALLAASLADDQWLEDAAAVVIIAADRQAAIEHFSDQQADGLRGLRYIDFEAGAAAQNMALMATREKLGSVVVMGIDHDKLRAALPIPSEAHPVALFCLGALQE